MRQLRLFHFVAIWHSVSAMIQAAEYPMSPWGGAVVCLNRSHEVFEALSFIFAVTRICGYSCPLALEALLDNPTFVKEVDRRGLTTANGRT